MFFILHAKLQGVFISVYGGGVWMWDQHEYTRDSLTLDKKNNRRKQMIEARLKKYNDIFAKDVSKKKKYYEIFEETLKTFDINNPKLWAEKTVPEAFAYLDTASKDLSALKDLGQEDIYPVNVLTADIDKFKLKVDEIKERCNLTSLRNEYKTIMFDELKFITTDAGWAGVANQAALKQLFTDIGMTASGITAAQVSTYHETLKTIYDAIDRGDREKAIGKSIVEAQKKLLNEMTNFSQERREELQKSADEIFKKRLDAEPATSAILTHPLEAPYVKAEDGQPIYKKLDDPKSEFETNVKGVAAPERPIVPLYGVGVGYMGMLPGHAFWGVEASGIWPAMTIQYQLNAGASSGTSFGKVDVTFPISVRATAIVGKLLNPWVGLYTKVGGEFTRVNFVYNVEDEQPPFKKAGGGYTTKSKESEKGSEQLSANIFGAFAGVGAMFINGHWAISLEYNASKFLKTTIRKYDEPGLKDDGRARGYVYSGLHHRLLVRLMYMFN